MNNNELDILKDVSLDTSLEELEKRLLEENNIDKLNDIINIFNLNIKRKDLVRTGKLNSLQDKITAQIEQRLDNNANEFSNKDLLDYFKTLQDTINKADNSLDNIDTPAIQINQQQINVGNDSTELSRESKEKVKDLISKVLATTNYSVNLDKNNTDLEVIDIEND